MEAEQLPLEGFPAGIPEPIYEGTLELHTFMALLKHKTVNGKFARITAQFKNSIAKYGILQPLIVLAYTDDHDLFYRLGAGRKRLQAALELEMTDIPVRVYDGSLMNRYQVTLIENAMRQDNIVADYEAILELMNDGATPEDIVEATGMGKATVKKRMELGNLLPELLNALREEKIARTTAEAAAKLGVAEQRKLIEVLTENGKVTGLDIEYIRLANAFTVAEELPLDLFNTPDAEAAVTRKRFSQKVLWVHDPNGKAIGFFSTAFDAERAAMLLNKYVFGDTEGTEDEAREA